jgi:hypothetical protein
VIFFAKHNNIGSFIVAKKVLKNIEKLNKIAFLATVGVESKEDRKQLLNRFYAIL